MEVGFHRFTVHREDNQNSPENSDKSPPSPIMFHDTKTTSTSTPKRSRRGSKKRVVHVPIKEVQGARLKAETNAPPSDSWAWRKYGQKPIKGSPYPRGYYRCSSSKGCPARKQVERSRTDPTMVMVTYSCEHNHLWPRNTNHYHRDTPPSPPTTTEPTNSNIKDNQLVEEEQPVQIRPFEPEFEPEPQQKFTSLEVRSCGPFEPLIQTRHSKPEHESKPQQKFTNLEVGSCGPILTTTDQYRWFSDLDSTSTMLESTLTARDMAEDNDMATIFSIRDDEESFFADLGELPECTTVFRRRKVARAVKV